MIDIEIIQKPSVIITSIGRTGTRFFAKLLGKVVPASTSLHEPDVIYVNFKRKNLSADSKRFITQAKKVGFSNIVFKKLFGHFSICELSDTRLRSQKTTKEIEKELFSQRDSLVKRVSGELFVESNFGYYGLVDIIPNVYKNVRIVYIIRDGRDWVRSCMNWGYLYERGKIRSLLAHTWLKADELENDPYNEKWADMSRFEKVCWAWVRLNEFALTSLENTKQAKLFKFEDIFQDDRRYIKLDEMLDFCLSMPGLEKISRKSTSGFLDRKINYAELEYPGWDSWQCEQKERFKDICGGLMNKLGYII